VITNDTGSAIQSESDYMPYGGEIVIVADTTGNQYKFTGKERDTETDLDYFGARYYAHSFMRFMTPDWAELPIPIPYAHPGIPQTLNLYSYVANNPITSIDPDGHDPQTQNQCDAECQKKRDEENRQNAESLMQQAVNHFNNFMAGATTAWISNNLPGYTRPESSNSDFQLGQIVGDAAALTQSFEELQAGTTMALGGGAAELVPGGQVPATAAVGTGLAVDAHGATVGVAATGHLMKDMFGGTQQSSVHGNTAGNQPAERYKKYDKKGKFLKHGVSQNASKRYTKKQLNGGRVVVVERGPRSKMLRNERKAIETNPGPENHEPWAGAKQK
jgi:RHS repeat-associated protein